MTYVSNVPGEKIHRRYVIWSNEKGAYLGNVYWANDPPFEDRPKPDSAPTFESAEKAKEKIGEDYPSNAPQWELKEIFPNGPDNRALKTDFETVALPTW